MCNLASYGANVSSFYYIVNQVYNIRVKNKKPLSNFFSKFFSDLSNFLSDPLLLNPKSPFCDVDE
jgi:hypothetical protein